MKYIKKPIVIEAFIYGVEPRPDWFNDKVTSNEIITYVGTDVRDSSEYYCEIKTLEGVMRGNCNDYIIKGVKGEVYACKPDIFKMTYELLSTQTDKKGNPLTYWGGLENNKQDLEEEIFNLEQALDIPSHLRFHNSKVDKVEKLAEISSELQEGTYTPQHKTTYKHGFIDGYNKSKEYFYTKQDLIDLVESLKNYTKESHTILGHDDREPIEFVDIFLQEISDDQDLSLDKEEGVWELGLEQELNKLPYTKHLDDGQYNDGQIAGFELGATWCYNKVNKFTISDDVLFEQATVAMEEVYGYGCETEIDAYFRGAKWILKQFKK